jgi:hypothetical protein
MSLFDWLLVGHLVGDFLLQSDNMAQNKGHRRRWMITHVGLYMAVITIVLVVYGLVHPLPLGWAAAAWLFLMITHVILDLRSFTARWMRLVGMTPDHTWLSIVIDQVFHVLTLAVAAQVLALVQG